MKHLRIQNKLNSSPKLRAFMKTVPVKAEVSGNEATIFLYDEIDDFWGVSAQDFVKELNSITADVVHLRMNTPGGDVFAARAMETAIRQHKAKVIAHIDGFVASAGTYIAAAADEVEIVEGGFYMIHNAASLVDILGYFSAQDLEALKPEIDKQIDLLAKVDDSIVNSYAQKTGKETGQIRQWMAETTWFNAEEALENGFVDRIYKGEVAENKWDLSVYANAPDIKPSKPAMDNQPSDVDTAALLRRLELEINR
jgi:ATP-dependent Clp protease protease subunit